MDTRECAWCGHELVLKKVGTDATTGRPTKRWAAADGPMPLRCPNATKPVTTHSEYLPPEECEPCDGKGGREVNVGTHCETWDDCPYCAGTGYVPTSVPT